jgi:hypothetical protein
MVPRRPSNPQEARAVLDAHLGELRKRSYEDLRQIEGEEKRSYLGGLVREMDGPGSELDEVVAPSGALYNFVTRVWVNRDGSLSVSVTLQEDAEPYGSLDDEFTMAPDGSLVGE